MDTTAMIITGLVTSSSKHGREEDTRVLVTPVLYSAGSLQGLYDRSLTLSQIKIIEVDRMVTQRPQEHRTTRN